MKPYFNRYKLFILALFLIFTSGCKKYLDEKSVKNLVIPSSLKDAQALLDNPKMIQSDLSAGEVSSDDYYLQDTRYQTLADNFRRMYIWEKDYLFTPNFNDWRNLYDMVYINNTVLETLEKIERTPLNSVEWDNIKGQALFFRAHFIMQGALIWCKAYDEPNAVSDPGMPLRLSTNFNEASIRSSLKQTYGQIISDLKSACELLGERQTAVTRPDKWSANGLLARTYLSMRDYPNAGQYANICLQHNGQLIDFNSLVPSDPFPIKQLNEEVIFESRMSMPLPLLNTNAVINAQLYASYTEDDLRRSVFFAKNTDGTFAFKGSYEGGILFFSGISNNELYLIRAEANAHQNKLPEAMKDLNDLLVKRWRIDPSTGKSSYISQSADNPTDALNKIRAERRKELLMRGLRWMDIKRLNKEDYEINQTRNVLGQSYVLAPNDPRYALPIPEDIILSSGIQQNDR